MFKYLRKKEHGKMIENIISLSVLELVNVVLPLLTLPYILRVLGKDGYGVYVTSFAFIGYFITLIDYSFSVIAPRDIAMNRDNKEELNKIYSKVMFVKITLLTISVILYSALVFLIPSLRVNWLSYVFTIPMLFGSVMFTAWLFQGLEEMKFITFINASVKILFTISIFLLITKPEDFNTYILLQSGGYLLAGIAGQYIVHRKYKMQLVRVDFNEVIGSLKKNFPLFLKAFLPNIYVATGVLLLGIYHTKSVVGTYGAITKLATIGLIAINILVKVFFPYLSRNKGAFQKTAKITIILGCVITVLTILSYPLAFWFLDIKGITYLPVFIIYSFNILLISIDTTLGQNYLIINGKEKLYIKATAIGALSAGLIVFPMVYYFSALGAAIVVTFGNLIGTLLCYKYYLKSEKRNFSFFTS